MAAYIIVDVTIHDPAQYDIYKSLTPGTLAAYGGKFVARGGKAETLEGDWTPGRMVILEFPDAEHARAWWSSDQYAEPKALRHRIATSRMVLVEGV